MRTTLGKSIVILVVGTLLGTAFLLGSVAYLTTRSSIVNLRRDLLKQVDERVQERVQQYFDRAGDALNFLERVVFTDPDLESGWEGEARLLDSYLKIEPGIVWFYYADHESGAMLGCNIDQLGRYVISWIHPDNSRIARGFEVQEDGSLETVELVPKNPNPYDPRDRPWYQKAIAGEGLVWTPPYGFLSSKVIGITAARALRDDSGKVRGVLGADFELGRLAAFLDEFDVGESGAAFILMDGGVAVVPGAARAGEHVETLQNAFESRYWDFSDLKVDETLEEGFEHEGKRYLALIQPIDLPGPTRYFAGVVVPRDEYLSIVYRNLILTIVLGILILGIATALGVWQARRVTGPLARIGDELENIGNLSFQDGEVDVRSNIREVAIFSDSVGKMKVSLRAFSRYVPRDLVRLLLSRGDEANLGGSLRKVTVVFTDLVGFTAFSESLTPDEAFSELSEFLEIVAECQEKFQGITSSFTGDGTLALFNAPKDHSGHERDACFSALELLAALRRCNEVRKAEGKFEFHARIGINTADVLLGNLGTRERFAYTAIGDGVNLASRLEGLSKFYGTEILVGSDTREAAEEEIEWRLIDRIAVVGRRQATKIYEPLGRKGELDDVTLRGRDQYEAALESYFEGNLDAALAEFHEAALNLPRDRPTRVLMSRCQRYLREGLPENWNGTFSATLK
ncbi:MAG: adenylate/guanylate cyclase domain-containing protein [Verrucomicrobiales bacterium]|nr:adenylate/guanylate cyclase domain-containing protein [Verrucomicrobiales bacterium]